MTRLAARLLGAPVALVTLLGQDRVFFKSAVGLAEPWATRRSTPLAYSFCRHVVASATPLVVEDARRHPLVRTSPAIRELGWIAYAGVPLTMADGRTVGALCVVDALPRIWSPRDVALLEDLAASVVTEIELRSPRQRLELVAGVTLPPPPTPPDPGAGVFEASALPMGLVQSDGRWLRANRALAELLGTTPDALAGRPAEAFTHPADRAVDQEAMRLLRTGECASYATEKRLLREGEEPLWVLSTVTAVSDDSGALDHYHVALQDITDRKQAELDLRQREERYRLVAEVTQDAVWDWDLLTDRIVWAERREGIFGYRHPAVGASAAWWYERLHPDDRERVVSGMHAAIARGGADWRDEYRFRRADGTWAHVRDQATIIRDEGGDAVRMVGALLDTTERTRAELVAHGQSRLLEQIAAGLDLDAVLDRVVRFTEAHGTDLLAAVTLLDPDTGELRLAAAPSFPAGLRQAVSSTPFEIGAGVGAAAALGRELAVYPDLAADPSAERWRGPLVEQGIRASWAVPLVATDGGLLGALEVHYREPRAPDPGDVRLVEVAGHLAEIAIERGRSQEAIARGMRLLEQVLDTLPLGVCVLDRAGRVMFSNPAGRAIWGGARHLGLEEFGAYRGWRVDTGEPIAPEGWAAARALRQGETALGEVVQIEAFDGVQRTILNSAVPLRGLDGSILGAIVLDEDITERRAAEAALHRSEEQLLHAQKMEAVGQLAGGIAHDFNNLLTGILSYSDLVLQELRPDDPIRADLEQIRHAGQRAAALTRQLLAFSRRQVLQPRVLSLNASVTELDSLLHRLLGADITLETELDPGLWYVLADPGQLEQVLVNLVVNARDAMPDGGVVTVTTAPAELSDDQARRFGSIVPGPCAILTVSDTGSGMDEETRLRVFEPFFTTKPVGKGTGLGLSMVYGIVEQHGGAITVESSPGHGTTFRIYLPRVADVLSEPEGHAKAGPTVRGSETILLVEDETEVRDLVAQMLQGSGYTVLTAPDPGTALALSEQHRGLIHLLLTDVVLPEMSGRELRQRLRESRPRTKVLYMSGYTDEALGRHGALEPDVVLLQKPFSVGELGRKIREILDGRDAVSQ